MHSAAMTGLRLAFALAAAIVCLPGRSLGADPLTVGVQKAPAVTRGAVAAQCSAPAFRDIATDACWKCPASAPRRTVFPVTATNACEGPASEVFSKAQGPRPAGGVLGTDCPTGYFLDVGERKCYACPKGYNRSLHPIGHARACSKVIPAAHAPATKVTAGCPAGAFRNGLLPQCYSCPAGYARSLAIGTDLTKVPDACVKVAMTPPKIVATPPADLGAQAQAMVARYGALLKQALISVPKAQAALVAGKDMKAYRDPDLEASGRAALFKSIGLGFVADGSTPWIVGGNFSYMYAHNLDAWTGVGLLATLGLTGTVPASSGGDLQVVLALLTKPKEQQWGFAWGVEVGYHMAKGADIRAMFGFTNEAGAFPVTFEGFRVGGGVGGMTTSGFEGDIGVSLTCSAPVGGTSGQPLRCL